MTKIIFMMIILLLLLLLLLLLFMLLLTIIMIIIIYYFIIFISFIIFTIISTIIISIITNETRSFLQVEIYLGNTVGACDTSLPERARGTARPPVWAGRRPHDTDDALPIWNHRFGLSLCTDSMATTVKRRSRLRKWKQTNIQMNEVDIDSYISSFIEMILRHITYNADLYTDIAS